MPVVELKCVCVCARVHVYMNVRCLKPCCNKPPCNPPSPSLPVLYMCTQSAMYSSWFNTECCGTLTCFRVTPTRVSFGAMSDVWGDVRRFATRCWELLGDPNLVPCVAYGVKRRTRWGKPRKHFGELLRHNREKLRGRAERYDQKWTRFVIGFFRG